MKKLALCLLCVTACELQPAPKQAPAPVGSAGSAVPVAVTPPPPPADAAIVVDAAAPPPPPPPVQATADCEKAAVHFAELFIADAPASQRGIYEQDRANTVRRTEVACTQQQWTPASLACIEQAKSDRDARACLDKFPPPGAPPKNRPVVHPPRD